MKFLRDGEQPFEQQDLWESLCHGVSTYYYLPLVLEIIWHKKENLFE